MAEKTKADLEFLNALDGIDQDTVEEDLVGYPWIQWVHGSPQMKQLGGVPYTGGWFMPLDASGLDDEAEIEGWERGSLMHSNGDESEGFFARDITVALIRSRRAWQVYGDGGRTQLFPWNAYDEAKAVGRPSGKLQMLCVVRGLAEPRPVVLTVHGSVSQAFSVSRTGDSVLNAFNRCVVTPANKLASKAGKAGRWPYRAFWLTVGPDRDKDGNPIFVTVGDESASSKVTLPIALGLSEKMAPKEIAQRFVGADLLDETTAYWRDAEEWASAWDEMTDVTPSGDEEVEPDETGVYASEDDIPF